MSKQELPAEQGVAPAETASGPADNSWREYAQCVDVTNPDIFVGAGPDDIAAAKKYCGRCAVQQACLDDAITKGVKLQIRGGMTDEERQALSQ